MSQGTLLVIDRTGWVDGWSCGPTARGWSGMRGGRYCCASARTRSGCRKPWLVCCRREVLAGGTGAALLVQLAVAIMRGATNLLEAEGIQSHHGLLLGAPASDSTVHRALAALDGQTLLKIARVRHRVRRHVWSRLRLRPGGFPWLTVAGRRLTGWIVIDLDATAITAASKNDRAAAPSRRPGASARWPPGARTRRNPWSWTCGRAMSERLPSRTTSASRPRR